MKIRIKALAKLARLGVLLDKDGTIRGYNESQSSITLRVPYLFQEHVNLCTDASAMMILLAWGFEPNRDLSTNPRGPFEGSSIESHTDLLDPGVFWHNEPISQTNKPNTGYFYNMLKRVGPLGVQNKGHAQVLIGVDAMRHTVILHDPWKGPNKVNTFKKFIGEMRSITYLHQVGRSRLPPDPDWKN